MIPCTSYNSRSAWRKSSSLLSCPWSSFTKLKQCSSAYSQKISPILLGFVWFVNKNSTSSIVLYKWLKSFTSICVVLCLKFIRQYKFFFCCLVFDLQKYWTKICNFPFYYSMLILQYKNIPHNILWKSKQLIQTKHNLKNISIHSQ